MKLIKLEDIFSQEVVPPAVILVEGSAGTLKSGLCFSLMQDLLKDPEKFGLYITLEQTWDSHMRNMNSLGFSVPGNLLSLDYNIMRKEFKEEETHVRIFDSILDVIASLDREKKGKLTIFTLDSLNAIYSIMDRSIIENSLLPFFRKLREHNIISLIIHERLGMHSGTNPNVRCSFIRERYLADGIISLGVMNQRGDMVRYLQPLKFTFGEHSLQRCHLVAGKDGLSLLGPVYR